MLGLQKYRSAGFNLIGFPCNQFGGQAPKSSDGEREAAFSKFGFEFPIMVSTASSCQMQPYSSPFHSDSKASDIALQQYSTLCHPDGMPFKNCAHSSRACT